MAKGRDFYFTKEEGKPRTYTHKEALETQEYFKNKDFTVTVHFIPFRPFRPLRFILDEFRGEFASNNDNNHKT